MSLETLLEAAEFLEWNKAGKKSRATRTSKKAEKFKPTVITERKRKAQTPKQPAQKVVVPKVHVNTPTACSSATNNGALALSAAVAVIGDDLVPDDSEDDEDKIIMRDLRRSIGSRETHNKLEKNRRAHLKECFEMLRCELPATDERRSSNLSTLRSALRLIEQLTLKQRELESEKRRMCKLKNSKLSHISSLKKELKDRGIEYNLEDWIEVHRTSTNSTSTASECGDALLGSLVGEEANEAKPNPTLQTAPELQFMLKADTKPVVLAPPPNTTQQLLIQQQNPGIQVAAAQPATGTETTVQSTQPQPQVVRVAKISRGSALPAGKIVLTPKVMSTGTVLNQMSAQTRVSTSTAADPGGVYLSTLPSQSANIVVPASQQVQPLTEAPVPLTVNPPPRIVRPLHQQLPANLSIAPKQLLLITAGTGGGAAAVGQHQTLTPSTITLPMVEQPATHTLPANTATHIIPLSSLTNSPQATLHNVHPVQASVPKPTIIHGVLPSKKSDGTVSYLPIKFTKPAAPTTVAPMVASLPVATTYNSTFFAGGGVTIVIPPAATAVASSAHNVQLVTNAPASSTL